MEGNKIQPTQLEEENEINHIDFMYICVRDMLKQMGQPLFGNVNLVGLSLNLELQVTH